MNTAFEALRLRLPNVPKDTKLPKIKILRFAARYIFMLAKVMEEREGGEMMEEVVGDDVEDGEERREERNLNE